MKTTRRGRPFAKDTHDLFATLIVSLQLTTHRHLFKSYPNSFTTDEAAENLSALKFSQSNRAPDPKEPSRVITTTTTTTFSMSRDMAKGICQHFMDARLIENAADLASTVFKDKGIYMITPKGLHILERFITKNGINGEHLVQVFSTQPICMKLLHLERRTHDDELLINRAVLEVIFRRFAGRQPNQRAGDNADLDRTMGIEVQDVSEKAKGGRGTLTIKHTFTALSALEWLCDFTTICGRDEAAEMAAHFVRLKFMELVQDKSSRKENEGEGVIQVQGDDGVGGISQGEFRCHFKVIYGMTDWGRSVARWPGYNAVEQGQTSSFQSRDRASSINDSYGAPVRSAGSASPMTGTDGNRSSTSLPGMRGLPANSFSQPHQNIGDTGSSGGYRSPGSENDFPMLNSRDSNSKRLKQILEEPALRSIFRDFLKQNFCEENLSFWLDVQDFKRRFNTTSSAVAVRGPEGSAGSARGEGGKGGMGGAIRKLGGKGSNHAINQDSSGWSAMEKHQQDLIAMAFVIYNTYLAPGSTCELNVEHNMRTELVTYMTKIIHDAKSGAGLNQVSAKDVHRNSSDASGNLEERRRAVFAAMPRAPLHASQLQTMVRMYERIQDHIFRLMATDSVPRFIKDPKFLNLVHSVEEYAEALEAGKVDPSINAGPGLGKSVVDAMELGTKNHRGHEHEVDLIEALQDTSFDQQRGMRNNLSNRH
ncbi:regulator of G protein signaling superfamily [Meira miltonrushii]|uniref:Regulator of G protein signaling superfamily n=1 Tax=Meira miltonrushii TaxID=1280837 RepID=A0A316VG46_9BASI|nr:regulator of G protein signaling superfamily [Meira miltonrushii]PWN34455.1 regulator of G protein signaling superfamily [Meira miltonrushii]